MTTRMESAPAVDDAPRPARAATLVELLVARLDDAAARPALATEPSIDGETTSWTWLEAAAAAVELAAAIEATGLRRGDRVVHVGTHSVDWIVVDLACLLAGVVHAALHADAPRAELLRQIAWLAPGGIVLSGEGGPFPTAGTALPLGGLSGTRRVVDRRCPPRSHGPRAPMPVAGLRSDAWRSLAADPVALRHEVARRAAAIDPDAPARIFLSSGTTGRPRGYVHSQRSLATNAQAAAAIFLDEADDVRLSWLPMSHALACTGDLSTALVRGGCLNVVPDRRRFLDACRFLPPTVILGVPALWERLERGVRSGAIADLAAALGGRVRVCISGGAALRGRTQALFAARGIPLVEGYGLAEAGPVVALDSPRGCRPGWVGRALEGIDVRLDADGQLLVRTPSRALGLLLPPDAPPPNPAAEVGEADADGWIATGDTAEIGADGRIRITGRVVDTLVLATGAKLPPAEVERVLADDPLVAQVCVCGDRLPAPVALIVPEPTAVRAALRSLGIRVASRRSALRHPRLLRWLARRIAGRQASLPRPWQVRRIVLVNRPFDIDHGEMTHSMKLKRPTIADHFAATLDAASAPSPPPGVAVVPRGDAPIGFPATSGLVAALWGRPRGDDGGFAAAAARAAQPLSDGLVGVLEEAERRLDDLRSAGSLYAPGSATGMPPAPLDDAPPPPEGMVTPAAEAALGEAGLWGVHVPVAHGGCGGSVLDLVRSVTRIAGIVPSAAGMLAVHSSIGAVSALMAFGSPQQQARYLPGLAAGKPLSVFGATEPEVGCDLGAVRTTLTRRDGRLVVDGTKMFITNATYGRLVKLLAVAEGKPAVVLARLPDRDTPHFRLLPYALHPLRHTPNHALEFRGFAVDEEDLVAGPAGDAMAVVWHGLNRGRSTLAAQAAGTLGLLLAHAREHALRRTTWGQPIASRQLVQGRLARIAAGRLVCEALSTWAAATIDASGGAGGELEAITAKVVASQAVREGAIDALGIHGGRAFLVGHPLGDSFHDHLAVGVYEGESDLLGLALFKGLSRRHPLAERLRHGSRFRAAAGWLGWRVARWADVGRDAGILDRRLREHAAAARKVLARSAVAIDRAIRRHGRGLAERQLEVGALSAVVRDAASVLAVAHHADATGDDAAAAIADGWCRMALGRATGRRLTPSDHAAIGALGLGLVDGSIERAVRGRS